MVSGTPILTTKLPGMPKEYYNYIYTIEEDSPKGVADALEAVLTKSREELHQMGMQAQTFVLEKKNHVLQARRILDLLSK